MGASSTRVAARYLRARGLVPPEVLVRMRNPQAWVKMGPFLIFDVESVGRQARYSVVPDAGSFYVVVRMGRRWQDGTKRFLEVDGGTSGTPAPIPSLEAAVNAAVSHATEWR